MFDSKDLKKTKGSFQSKSNKLSNVLDGTEYWRFVNIVSRNWTDEESEKFLSKMEESIKLCQEEIRKNNNKVQSLIDTKLR